MKIVYVARQLHFDGLKLSGRSLVRHLAAEHDVRVVGALVPETSPLLEGHLAEDVMSVADLRDVDLVYMEGGWNRSNGEPDRFPLDDAEQFVRRGGQLIVADVDRNVGNHDAEALKSAAGLFHAGVRYQGNQPHSLRYLFDAGAQEDGCQRFFTSEMRVTDWLTRAVQGIDSLLTWGAVDLLPGGGIAASGHKASTRILSMDVFVEPNWCWTWASAAEHGKGHVVLIGAQVSYDYLVEACPDNARWLGNLAALLLGRTQEAQAWRRSNASGRATEQAATFEVLLSKNESQQLERKSSFSVSVDPGRADVPSEVLQHSVGKSIAALANTDGGHLVIGQADDLEVLGLASDYAVQREAGRDEFERRLTQYCDKHMSPRWEAIGLRVWWLDRDGKDLAIVEVPKSSAVVHLTDSKKVEHIYVRRGTRTDSLKTSEIVAWVTARTLR